MIILTYVCIKFTTMEEITTRIPDDRIEKAAYVLRTVAHPVRIQIIDILDQREDGLAVSELQDYLNLEQSLASHHLKSLRDKGILGCRREGKSKIYYLVDKKITKIIDCINGCDIF